MADKDENILYDLLINVEWPPETDAQLPVSKEQSTSVIAETATGALRSLRHYLPYSSPSSRLPPRLVRLTDKQIKWQLELASNGELLAVVRDQCIEIRSAKDDFVSTVGKCQVPDDPFPKWRRAAWSRDCTLLAYADSAGSVRIFDLTGSELFTVPPGPVSFPGDVSCAAAGLVFLEYTASAQWSAELLIITYRGGLKSYLIAVGTDQSIIQENHTFSFNTRYPHGVTAAVYHPGHRMLLVGGRESGELGTATASCCGITAWRILSGSPYYMKIPGYEDVVSPTQKKALPHFRFFSKQGVEQEGVFRFSLSPDGRLLAVIHLSGSLTLWEVPTLRQRAAWSQDQQPGFDDINPDWNTCLKKRKKLKEKEQYYPLSDVSWWSNEAVILARCSGSLSVTSVRTLRNLLGETCEWLEPAPRLTAARGGRFLGLECEVQKKSSCPDGSLNGNEGKEAESDSDSDAETSPGDRGLGYVKQGIYYVTELGRFAPPPRKQPCTLVRNYRLVSLTSTTPMELYRRKIDHEEYGEALSVAQAYDLDTDLVYQRRWSKSSAGIAPMQDYLSKIRKRSTVLLECIERVPGNVDAAKELLEYGLKGSDLETLIAIGKGEDGGRFAIAEDPDLNGHPPCRGFFSAEEELKREMERKERENSKRQALLAQVDFSRMKPEQKELCVSRLKLLRYLDRLATYEEVLGGPHAAEEKFDAEFFCKFRSQNIILSAVNYARESDVQALDVLFTYHGADLLEHRLAILFNLPETTSPHKYATLLPEARLDDKGDEQFTPWMEQRHRDLDWCETEECRKALDQTLCDDDHDYTFLYEEAPELLRFRTLTPSIQLLTDWYLSRAQTIESISGQVDCALALVSLGKERRIPGLESLCDDLITMETLIYEMPCETSVTLQDLRQLGDIDKLRLLMNHSSQERYAKDVLQRMMPFLHRCEIRAGGESHLLLREYLVSLARRDLSLPLTVFQHSKPDCQQMIIKHSDQLMTLALECIYSSERDDHDQLSLCYDILECLPQRGFGQETDLTLSLHDRVDRLEKHLGVLEVLGKHGLQKPVSYMQNSQDSEEEAYDLVFTLCRHIAHRDPPAGEAEWRGLLQDVLRMQRDVYTCLQADTCLQVYVESLLCSGRVENICLAGHFMHCSKVSCNMPPVTSHSFQGKGQVLKVAYDRSVELMLATAREYFNSSTSSLDPCVDLAKACLQLITDFLPVIQEEQDLISALCQLEAFGVNMLPPQVRLRTNRLSIIEDCVSQCPTAYKQSAAMLHLARLLRVAGNDEAKRKGQVLTLLAEHSLRCQDFEASYIHCQDLMSAGYGPGWKVCSQLGQSEAYTDLEARELLLAFSLTHCPPNDIHSLLAASSDLHTRVLHQAVNNQSDPTDAQTRPDGDPTTKVGLTEITDNSWFNDSFDCTQPIGCHGTGSSNQEAAGENVDLERQGCHPFYKELFNQPYIDPSQDVFVSLGGGTPRENFTEVLLKTGKLAETKTEGQSPFSSTELLLQLADEALPRDLTLALAYLLALPQVLDANRCFEKHSQSAVCLQLAAYYYSLLIYAHLAPCFMDKSRALYQANPTSLIQMVTRHVSSHSDWPEELQKLIGQLFAYNGRLAELTQNQMLQGLCRGVDIQRFNSDTEYKKESILGLAETLEDDVFRTSLWLAQRYDVPLWDVYMSQLEFLFTDSGLSTNDIERRSQSLGLFEWLKTEPLAFHNHMMKYVLPAIEGSDLGRLLYYYTLLEAAGCRAFITGRISLDTHVKLLRKLCVIAEGLDYLKLTDGSSDPLAALRPVLTSQNVLTVSKLAHHLPIHDGNVKGATLTASAVHTAWLQRLFWNGDPQLLKRPPQGDRDFLHAYDICSRYLERLSPADIVLFLDDITLSTAAVNKLSIQARSEVVSRADTALRQLGEKWTRMGGEETGINPAVLTFEQETNLLLRPEKGTDTAVLSSEQEGTETAVSTFEQALSHLKHSQAHLDALGHAFIVSLRDSRQAKLRGYSRAFDLCRSERPRVHELAVTMATDGQPLELIGELLTVIPLPDLSVRAVIQDAVQRLVSALSGHTDTLSNYPQPLRVLESIVSAVYSAMESGYEPVTLEHLLAWLRPFCRNNALPIQPRCDVLHILQSNFSLGDSDIALLLLHRTRDVLRDGQRVVQMEDVENEEKRHALFRGLLGAAEKWEEFKPLVLLLRVWPPMAMKESSNPWVELTSALLTHCPRWEEGEVDGGQRVLSTIRSLYGTEHRLPMPCIRQVAALLLDQPGSRLAALKLMAESGDQQLLQLTLDQVNGMTPDDADEELLSLLLDAGLLVGCVSSALYPALVSLLLAGQQQEERRSRWDVEEVASQLLEAGHGPEAGSLLLAHRGSNHQEHGSLGAALAVLRKWL